MSERIQTRRCNESATCPLVSNKSKQSKHLDKNSKFLRLHPPLIQAKLAISEPGDKYEQEADKVAKQVMKMPESVVLQHNYAKYDKDEKEVLQSKESPGLTLVNQHTDVPSIVHEVLRSPGQPLDMKTRSFMEPRFGYDFSRIRIHTNAKAAKSAKAVNALAYTVGQNVVFGDGRYAPSKPDGQYLLAHELIHTIQQSHESGLIARSNETLLKSKPHDIAETIIDGQPLTQLMTAPIILSRETKSDITNSTYNKITEITLWVDLNRIQVKLDDNTIDDKAALVYNGHPNAGTYIMVRRGNKFVPEGPTASRIGGTPNADEYIFYIKLGKGSTVDVQSYKLIVIGGKDQDGTTAQAPIEVTITGSGQRTLSQKKKEKRDMRGPGGEKDSSSITKSETVKSETLQPSIAASQIAQQSNKSNDEMLAKFKALPESIKNLLSDEKQPKLENLQQLLRIANKLKKLQPEDLVLYKLLAKKLSTDLDAFELSVDFFVQFKEQIKSQANIEKTKQISNKELALDEKLSNTWSRFDEKKFEGMDVTQKETLARDIAAQQRNIQLEHMITHPGETAVGMAESVVRVDKTAKAIAEDVQDAVNGDKSAYTRIAGAVGAYSKYVAATASIVFIALLFVPGVNLIELAAAGLAVAVGTIALSIAESELRIKAAGEAKTAEDFKTETAKSASAQANAVVAAAMLALTLAMKIIARIPLPGRYQNVGVALKAAQTALLEKSGIGPAWQVVKNELLGKLRSSKQGLPEALAEQSKSISETANVVEGMSGDEFIKQLAEGNPKLTELGISSDQAKAIQQISGTPEGKNIPDQLRLDSLKALQDAPVEAGKKVDQFIKNIDESIENVEKTQSHEQLKSAVDEANNRLSAEEQARQATKDEQTFVKKRLETKLQESQLDARIAEAEAELNPARQKTLDYQASREAQGKNLKGGPIKGIWDIKERIWLLKRQKAFPDRTILEQPEIVGVKATDGKIKLIKDIADKGRILDFVEVRGSRIVAGDLKSASEVKKSIAGGVKRSGQVEAEFKDSSKIGKQHQVEAKIIEEANKQGGKIVMKGKNVLTGETETIEIDPANYSSEVLTYEDVFPN